MTRIAESELILNSDGSVFHIHMKPEELADIVLLVGDPGRAKLVSSLLNDIEFLHESREFVSSTGTFNGKRMTVLSTGIGCDNIDIVMNELDALANIDFQTREVKKEHRTLTILRFGTTGSIQPEIKLGDLIFSHISIGCDGLMNWYANREKVTMSDFEDSFMKHVGWTKYLPVPYFVKASDRLIELFDKETVKGMTISASGFYGPQGRVLRMPLAIPDMIEKFESYRHKGWKITNFEMEGSAIAGIAGHLGHDAGTVCLVIANRYAKGSNPDYKDIINKSILYILDKLSTL
ncbi:MAG: nucleoside phosphorylase [Bacteroidales bacterium]